MDSLVVNERTVPTFPADTDDTIKERIAASLSTTPFMLWIQGAGGDVPHHGEWTAVDVYADLRASSFPDVASAINRYAEWLNTNSDPYDLEARQQAIVSAVVEVQARGGLDPDTISMMLNTVSASDVRRILSESRRRSEEHTALVRQTRDNDERTTRIFFHQTEDGVTSQLSTEATRSTCTLFDERYVPIPVMFDSIETVERGEGVHFARMGRFIKHHQGVEVPASALVFTPDENSGDLEDNTLLVSAVLPGDAPAGRYTTFRIWYERPEAPQGPAGGVMTARRELLASGAARPSLMVQFSYRRGELDTAARLRDLIPALRGVTRGINTVKSSSVLTMVRPRFSVVTEYLAHFVFSDPRNRGFTVDERNNTSRGRLHIVEEETRLRISVAVERTNLRTEPFTRVRFYDVGVASRMVRTRERVIRMLDQYKVSESSIAALYNQYLPADVERAEVRVMRDTTRTRLRREAVRPYLEQAEKMPELFVPYYTRSCAQPRLPKILNSPDEAQGRPVHQFPIKGEAGQAPRSMVCPANFPNFGLMDNSLSNSDDFEYIPCCYVKDTTLQPSMLAYYSDQERAERVFQPLYVTNRLLPLKSYGLLPPGPAMLFDILGRAEPRPLSLIPEFPGATGSHRDEQGRPVKHRALRCGVNKGPNAFLEAVLRALHVQEHAAMRATTEVYSPPTITEEDLVRLRQDTLAPLQNVASQETWDLEGELVSRWLADPKLYLDPRRFVKLLEYHYNVNIYVFERGARRVSSLRGTPEGGVELQWTENTETPQGALVVPPHCPDGPYFQLKMRRETWRNIYVYVHQGSDIDRGRSEPHVEYVVTDNWDKAADLVSQMFARLAMTSKAEEAGLVRFVEAARQTAAGNHEQVLDRGGRCVKLDGVGLAEPMHPLAVRVAGRGRFDLDVVDPRASLEGRRIIQRVARMYLNLMVRTRAGESTEARCVVDPAAFSWPAGRIVTGFNSPLWRVEDVAEVVLDSNQNIVVDSLDTRDRLVALSDIVLNRMTANERAQAARRDYVSGYYHAIDDFTRRPGQLITLVRLQTSAARSVREMVVMYEQPAPVDDGQDVMFVDRVKDGVAEIPMRALHGEAAMLRVMNRGRDLSPGERRSRARVWDGSAFRDMLIRGGVEFDLVIVYRVAGSTVFLLTKENRDEAANQAVREMRRF